MIPANYRPLEGKTAIVTGASSGIGRAIAETIGGAGATVFLAGRTESDLAATRARIEGSGSRAYTRTLDVRHLDSIKTLISDAVSETARLDILVNSAGVLYPAGIIDGSPDEWREMLDTNILAVLTTCQLAVHAMRQCGAHGQIVNISSTASQRPDSGVYGATKHAVNCISNTLRRELRDDSIRVINVLPGATATNLFRYFRAEQLNDILTRAGADISVPSGRLPHEAIDALIPATATFIVRPQDIADAVLYAILQPPELELSEMIVRPASSILSDLRS